MELYLKITVSLLLLVHAFHLASLQDSTDSPGRTINKEWLRRKDLLLGHQNAGVPEEETEDDQGAAGEPAIDYSSGITSGSMAFYEEDDSMIGRHKQTNKNSRHQTTTVHPTTRHVTTKQSKSPHATVSPTTATTEATNSSQINMTHAEEEFHNSTTTQTPTIHLSAQNPSNFSVDSNHTDLQTTTSAPEGNATQESATKAEEDIGLTNATESTNTTTVTTTVTPEINETSTTSSSTPVFLPETTEMNPVTTTTFAPNTPEKANKTDKGSTSGSGAERGLESNPHRSKRNGAWGAILGTAVAVACVGLVAYFILKKKHQKGFSHRKLVEEYPSDPVHRLDNSEPLDLNFGGSAYYNPGLQGDNIQMTNFPGRH